MKIKPYSLSLIMPLLSIAPYFQRFFEEVEAYLTMKQLDYEIIIVHNKLKKKQRAIIDSLATLNPHIVLVQNSSTQSIATALRTGCKTASKDLICFYDASFRYDIETLDVFLLEIEARDFVLGYRFPRCDNFFCRARGVSYRVMTNILFSVNRKDINCAMQVFKRKTLKEISLESKSSAIYLEIVYKLQKRSKTYFEIPVAYLPKKYGTPKHLSIRELINYVVDVCRLKFNL